MVELTQEAFANKEAQAYVEPIFFNYQTGLLRGSEKEGE